MRVLGAYHQAASVLSGSLIVLLDWWLVDLDALGLNDGTNLSSMLVNAESNREGGMTYSLLESLKVSRGEGIGLGNDWDQVDTGA